MSLKEALTGILLSGSLFFSGCGILSGPEERVILGKIVWDTDGDGVYEGTPKANVLLFNSDSLKTRTVTSETGNFSFRGFFEGNCLVYSYKAEPISLSVYHQIREFDVYEESTNLKNIELIKIFSLWPP